MSAKHSKEVTDRIRSGDHLLSAFDVEGPRVAASFLDETRDSFQEGDEKPRPGGFLVAAGRKVRSSLDYLVETDFAVVRAEGWESVLRKQFKEDKRELAFCLVAFRRLVLAYYVEPDLANLGLEPVNVRDGMTIQRRGELVDERFEAPNLPKMLGESRFEPIDLGPYVARDQRGPTRERPGPDRPETGQGRPRPGLLARRPHVRGPVPLLRPGRPRRPRPTEGEPGVVVR